MSNSKISALTFATTPLAGTETLPIVQSSVTKQVSVADLTAGRPVSASKLTTTNATDVVIENIIDQPNPLYYSALTLKNSGASGKSYQLSVGGNTSALPGGMYIYNATAGTIPLTLVDASNNLTVGLGNVVIGTSGKGIDFSATPGTGTSELFNDYEEGTFTPSVYSGVTSPTYSEQNGKYTKIGNLVYLQIRITFSGGTGSGAQLGINGFPYASNTTFNGGGFNNYMDANGVAMYWYVPQSGNTNAIGYLPGGANAIAAGAMSGKSIAATIIYPT